MLIELFGELNEIIHLKCLAYIDGSICGNTTTMTIVATTATSTPTFLPTDLPFSAYIPLVTGSSVPTEALDHFGKYKKFLPWA